MAEPSTADIPGPDHDTSDEGRLIQRAGRGDHAALAALAGRYESSLLGLAQGLLKGREDLARDVVQDVWIRVLKSGSAFNGRSTAKTWLYRVTINRCHDLRAKADKAVPADAAPTPRISDFDAEQTSALRTAVEALKPEQRMLVILCYNSAMTHAQAAEILNLPVGTIKSRLNTALNDLRSILSVKAQTYPQPRTPNQGDADAQPARRLA